MGIVQKILSEKKIDKVSTICSDNFSIEVSEDFHIHFRNTRMEFDHQEWDTFAKSISKSYLKWLILGKPKVGDPENEGGQIYLHNDKISEVPGKENKAVTADELRVELQKWTDYVHIHYKWFRLEFTIDEFLEFSNIISLSADKLKLDFDLNKIPRRTGKFHAPCPKGKVDKKGDGTFWTDKGDNSDFKNAFKTVYVDDNNKTSDRDNNLSEIKNSRFSLLIKSFFSKHPRISGLLGITISKG